MDTITAVIDTEHPDYVIQKIKALLNYIQDDSKISFYEMYKNE